MKMKRNLIATAALILMTGCAKEINLNELDNNSRNDEGAIVFGTQFRPVTRATAYGADAAALLGNNFVIEGIKGDNSTTEDQGDAFVGANHQVVFDNYNVGWAVNTAGTTASNSSDWEYVGKPFNQRSTVYDASGTQSIKYWDYSKDYYDFVAYSAGQNTQVFDAADLDGDDDGTEWDDNKVLVSAISPTDGSYTVQGNAAALSGFYIADMVTVANADYNKVVRVSFRSLGSKIRIGLYETIPGYSVRDVKFYNAPRTGNPATEPASSATPAFYSGSANIYSAGTYTVSYPHIGTVSSALTDYNKAHVAISGSTGSASQAFAALNYNNSKSIEKTGDEYVSNNYLGETSNGATYPSNSTNRPYSNVLPNEGGTTLTLRLDYTLVSNDKSLETIEVKNAVAIIPSVYTSWKPGYAYTYIFKISDNTNGTTGVVGTSPEGLYPITLDAVVLATEDNIQETVTTVATPSITTYQHVPAANVTANSEYKAGTIYVIVDGKTDLNTKGQLYTVTGAGISEATVADALNIVESVAGDVTTGRNGIVLTKAESAADITAIVGPDGNNITVTSGSAASFAATASTTYAYVYDASPTPAPAATDIYTAVSTASGSYATDVRGLYTRVGDTYTEVTNENPVVPVVNTTYYKHYTNTNKVYAVKVIKVAANN